MVASDLPQGEESLTEMYYRRFDAVEIALHISVIVSFLGLALTGLLLKFSNAPWARILANLLGGVHASAALHRLFAMVTFVYFFSHVVRLIRRYRALRARGERLRLKTIFGPDSMVPRWKDLLDFVRQWGWYLGLARRPQWDRWSYFEKFDYFAVFWGVVVIGFSGLILWFKNFFSLILPGWILNVAAIIHGEEALLAVGFIFAIHFYNTHLRLESFPIDLTIFTGKMSREEFQRKHSGQYDSLQVSGELEKFRCPPPEAWQIRAARVFGFTALSIGLALLILILWASFGGW